jgi:hypothetical protein
MERLGLLGEENLIPTLDERPELRWLADEEGARWDVLAELGRIGDPGTFEEAVEWALQNRPSPEEAGAYVRCSRASTVAPSRAASEAHEAPRHPRPTRRTRTQEKERWDRVPYVYGLIGFAVAIVLAVIVLQLLWGRRPPMPLTPNHLRGSRTTETTGERRCGAMMNPFFRTPPPSDEEERRVARAIAWLALLLCTVVLLLVAVLSP